jgi:hypothetical protein
MKNLGVALKRMYSQRMSALLVDVDALIQEGDGPSIVFPSEANGEQSTNPNVSTEEHDAAKDGQNTMDEGDHNSGDHNSGDETEEDVDLQTDAMEDYPEVHARSGIPDVPQPAIIVDASFKQGYTGEFNSVDSPVRSPFRSSIPEGVSAESWNRAPDPPSMDLFPQGSEEWEFFNAIPDRTSLRSTADTAASSDMCPVPVPELEKPLSVEKTSCSADVAAVVNPPPAAVLKKPSGAAVLDNPTVATVLKKPPAGADVEMVHVVAAVGNAPDVAAVENPTAAAAVENKAPAPPAVENPVVADVLKIPPAATAVYPPENHGKESDVDNLPAAAVLKIPPVTSMCFLYIFL